MRTPSRAFTLLMSFAAACGPARPTAETPIARPTPDPIVDSKFVRFQLSRQFSPCAGPGADWWGCGEAVELRASGRLEHTRGDAIVGAQISRADLEAAVRVFTASDFVRLLDAPVRCDTVVADASERMELEVAGQSRVDPASGCRNEPAFQAVRAEVARLVAAYRR